MCSTSNTPHVKLHVYTVLGTSTPLHKKKLHTLYMYHIGVLIFYILIVCTFYTQKKLNAIGVVNMNVFCRCRCHFLRVH